MKSKIPMKILKKIAVGLLVILIAIQFYRPEKNRSDDPDYVAVFETETLPSTEVKTILKKVCYDCHSANTTYPWYNNIAPISYWLDEHIDHGKGHLDFSDWENYTLKKKDHKLEEVIEMVENGEMPLKEYTWTHSDARLTEEQRDLLINWAQNARSQYDLAQ